MSDIEKPFEATIIKKFNTQLRESFNSFNLKRTVAALQIFGSNASIPFRPFFQDFENFLSICFYNDIIFFEDMVNSSVKESVDDALEPLSLILLGRTDNIFNESHLSLAYFIVNDLSEIGQLLAYPIMT